MSSRKMISNKTKTAVVRDFTQFNDEHNTMMEDDSFFNEDEYIPRY